MRMRVMKIAITEYLGGYRISWKPSLLRRWRTVETLSLREHCPFRDGIHMVYVEDPDIKVNVDWCTIANSCSCPVMHLDSDCECPLLKLLVME